MRILRSQYLQLQKNAGDQLLYLNNNGYGENISNQGKKQDIGKEARDVEKTSMVLQRSESTSYFNTRSSAQATNIKILIENVDKSLKKLNVVVEFTQMNAMWLTRVYQTYENDLWHRRPRLDVFGNKKWYFYCGLCSKVYMTFNSMKSHLNLHFKFYPYVCKLCPKKYTHRKSATTHLTNTHKLSAGQWNNYLTS